MIKDEKGFTPVKYKQSLSSDKVGNFTGFTITETMVVVVVFTFVMSLALGVFLSSIRTQRVALFQQRLTTETSYALSMIEKKIRAGEEIKTEDIDALTSDSVELVNFDIPEPEDEERITVLVETRIKVEEDRYIEIKLQTTAKRR